MISTRANGTPVSKQLIQSMKNIQKQEINNNKALISRNHDLTNNEIESINGNHAKLKAAHEKLKAEVEAQNKFNSDNQVSLYLTK